MNQSAASKDTANCKLTHLIKKKLKWRKREHEKCKDELTNCKDELHKQEQRTKHWQTSWAQRNKDYEEQMKKAVKLSEQNQDIDRQLKQMQKEAKKDDLAPKSPVAELMEVDNANYID